MDINDPSSWVTSTLFTTEGPIRHWMLADFPKYQERWVTEGNQTIVPVAVAWDDALVFKRNYLGWATPDITGVLKRRTPYRNNYSSHQFAVSLDKIDMHVGLNIQGGVLNPHGAPSFHEPDIGLNNWFTLPATDGMPPRIVYAATFAAPPYDILTDDEMVTGGFYENRRFVIEDAQLNPRERKMPTYMFETVPFGVVIPAVGFVPYYDFEFTYTWCKVPYNAIPWAAIANCVLKINAEPFGYKGKHVPGRTHVQEWGKFQHGNLLFKGVIGKVRPYRGNNGEWIADLPYLFSYQPAGDDGTSPLNYGQLKVPVGGGGRWELIKERNVVPNRYLYTEADFRTLFTPEF